MTPERKPAARLPLLAAVAAQAAAAAIVFGGALAVKAGAGFVVPLVALLAIQGVAAAMIGSRLGLAAWWAPIHMVLPFAVAAALLWRMPPWVFLAAFVFLLLFYWNSVTGVPLYLTNPTTRATLAGLLPEAPGFRFIDLGSGFGGPIIDLAARRPDGRFTGVESAPMPYALTWARLLVQRRPNVDLRFGDFRAVDLGPYDVVYCFLSPVPMPALYEKAKREMMPGKLFVSNSFAVPGHDADDIVQVVDNRRTRLHLWRM
ncbi:MAG TPA: class I SAM-dependent methyltransferase [Rhodospirillales bacterium]